MAEERGDSRFSSFLIGFLIGALLAALATGGYGVYRERQVAWDIEVAKMVRLESEIQVKLLTLRAAGERKAAKAAEAPKEK